MSGKKFEYVTHVYHTGNLTFVRVNKAITLDTLPVLQKEFAHFVKHWKIRNILFDLQRVTRTDTAGVAALIDLVRYMKTHHIEGKIGLVNLSEETRSLIAISRVDGLFKEYASGKEAIEELA